MPEKIIPQKITTEEKIWAAISYIWVFSLLALAARKKDEFIRFHANQGVFLFICSLFVWFPIIGWLLGLIIAVLAIIGIIKAILGEKWELPYIGEMAKKLGDWIIKTLKL